MVVVVVPLVCGSLPRLQRLGHPGVARWDVVVAVGAVCFLLVEGRRVVVVCQALPCCRRVGCVVLVWRRRLVAFVVACLLRLMRPGPRPSLLVPACRSRPHSRRPCGGGCLQVRRR